MQKNNYRGNEMSNDKQFKISMRQYTQNSDKHQNHNKAERQVKGFIKILTWIGIGIAVVMFLMSLLTPAFTFYKLSRKDNLRSRYNFDDIEEIAVKTDSFDNGFYIYKTNKIPEIEIHAVSIVNKDIFIEDGDARITKYYFEKWNDKDKDNMIVEENYNDYKYGMTKKEKWFLDYKIYIEADDYDEVLDAAETIINFKRYMNNSKLILPCYIKINDAVIQPIKASEQTDTKTREYVKNEYNKIIYGNSSENEDIYNFLNKLYQLIKLYFKLL